MSFARKTQRRTAENYSENREIINLQLKKPKNWNWSLTTSKSSPNIHLPIINLYGSKGELLLKVKDDKIERQSWHSSSLRSISESDQRDDKTPNCNLRKVRNILKSNSNSNFSQLFNETNGYGRSRSLQKSKSEILNDKQLLTNEAKIITILEKRGAKYLAKNVYGKNKYKSDDCYERLMKNNDEVTNCYSKEFENNKLLDDENANKNYKTISCSAGTLIINEPSFKNNRRRRRSKSKETKPSNLLKKEQNLTTQEQQRLLYQYSKYLDLKPNCRLDFDDSLFKHKGLYKCDANSNYLLPQELEISDRSPKFPLSLITCSEELQKLHLLEKHIDKTLALNGFTNGAVNGCKPGNNYLENRFQVPQDKSKTTPRVFGRTSFNNVKMGANVSRHSTKGLDGRRSQSSGSICNGKGGRRTPTGDGQFCGSLPSYLDSNVCNNNHHDCEKSSMVNVERIPPLGDAAPLHWKFSDTQTVFCDQGYGSERSPEEEYPPSLPEHDLQCLHHMESQSFAFITEESTFVVSLIKGSRGLGLSVTGGSDSSGSWPGLIRIKRLFPHQPAATCGLLNVGDLLLEVNGITLTGLTNYEALEVLRTTPGKVELKVCRPPPDVLSCVSPISEVPPPPPRRDQPVNLTPPPYQPTPEDDLYHGEFEITLTKIHGSLGFTLRKEEDDSSSHYVRALVREPAISDGRIHAGDKIIAVNNVEISTLTHEQAVQYLRQAGNVVTLRLFRDPAPTPVSTLSPTELTPRTSFSRKVHLRPEAIDMLNDIAMRKIVNHDSYMQNSCSNNSPRKLKRQACPSDALQINDNCNEYLITDEQFHEGLFRNSSLPGEDDDVYNSLFSVDSDDCDRPNRPISLDLCNSKGTPVITRKPKFNFSLAHNAYELNNLDPEILDAPNLTYNLGKDDNKNTKVETCDNYSEEPQSMPQITFNNPGFSYKNPSYQSAHPACIVEKLDHTNNSQVVGENNMKKWKGSVLNSEEEKKKCYKGIKIENEYEVLAVELNRGWNSRLGFSLQGTAGVTYISAVYADSVAARDGRLKPGDRLIKVNDESVENMTTSEIIDLLRIVRGPVCIIVSRNKSL